jgi:hypothetical protein
MTVCREFFEKLDEECQAKMDNAIRGPRLREMGADRRQRLVEWESETASRFSPGPVANNEKIRKALFQGREVVDGMLHRNAFLSLDGVGFSADRTDHTTDGESKTRFVDMASADHPLYGYIDLVVADLRARQCKKDEKTESERAIAVYDTAIKDNVAHAEAFMIVKFSNTRPYKSIQTDLMEKYQPQVTLY